MRSSVLEFVLLGLLCVMPVLLGFSAVEDVSSPLLEGVWSGEDTNGKMFSAILLIKLTTNGQGVVMMSSQVGIPGTFTYARSLDRIICFTNDSPILTGTLRYDASADKLVYQESVSVAAALRESCNPVMLLRDTNALHDAMLSSMVGATNYHDVMSRLGNFINTVTNHFGAIKEKSALQKKTQQNSITSGSQPIRSETNGTSSAADSRP